MLLSQLQPSHAVGRWLMAIALPLLLSLTLFVPAAHAAIRTIDEGPGQVLYQTRTTLRDEANQRWQAIAFKRHKADGSEILGLRLVGFPGVADIDRSQPLRLVNSLGHVLTAADTSAKIFTNASSPEPYIGQYDLGAVLPEIQPAIPLELQIPVTAGDPITLLIPPPTLEEWQQLPSCGH
ncbi:DUF3122 domain-containing protein [Leptolyngbya iicbica]|uniref:DUF3122 domain-containing protein n=2 Tax=Cyanophyceae TaxID=3028117 RepID=A0A4Q7E9A5_9CYAN|nr:DUF3122 domain-containing protein [Leptolyngbya sp. LK]RZM78979.1 DUF3122 domain-containing protein [Leptolyngbya sp. LK]